MNRRDVLAAICIGTTASFAGCDGTGGDDPGGASGDDDPSEPTAEAPPSGGESESTEASGSSEVSLEDVQMHLATNYRFRVDASGYDEASGDVVMEGSWHEGNYEMSVTSGGQSYRSFFVDGTVYYEMDGQCMNLGETDQQTDIDAQEWADTDATVSELDDWAGLSAAGTTTVDGEQMYVFELTPEEHNVEATYTYYVSAETGYFRRFESEGMVVDYWDWGRTDPIEAPC